MDREIIFEKVYLKTRKFILKYSLRYTSSIVGLREWNWLSMAKYSRLHLSQIWARFLIIFKYKSKWHISNDIN